MLIDNKISEDYTQSTMCMLTEKYFEKEVNHVTHTGF